MKVEDVTARQLLVAGGSRHLLTAYDADVVTPLQVLSSCIRKPLIHVDSHTPAVVSARGRCTLLLHQRKMLYERYRLSKVNGPETPP